jgi:hypothetical protein
VAIDWNDEVLEDMATRLGVVVLTLIDHGATREDLIELVAGYHDRLMAKKKEESRTSLRSIPLPKANEGTWDDACAGCGYLQQHCECGK